MDRFLEAMAIVRGGPNGTLQTMVDNLADKPLVFHPGTRWLYGLSTDLCGRLVEVISGQSFDDYLHSTIFEPLQMRDTAFSVPDEELHRFAASYGRRRNKTLKLLDDPERSTYRRQPSFLSGGGGLVSTTEDYLRFCRMLLGGGELEGVRVLGRKTVELMTINHLPGMPSSTSLRCQGATARRDSMASASASRWPSDLVKRRPRRSAPRATSIGAARRRRSSGSTRPKTSS